MDDDAHGFPGGSPDLAFEIGRSKLGLQFEAIDALDNKVGVTFGFASAILAIPLALLALDPEFRHWLVIALLSGGGVAYLVCSVLSFLSLRPRDWSSGPNLTELWDLSRQAKYSGDGLRWWAAEVYQTSYEANERPLSCKAQQTLRAMVGLAFETALMAGGLIAALALSA